MKKRSSKKVDQSLITIERSVMNYLLLAVLSLVLLVAAVAISYAAYTKYTTTQLAKRAVAIHSNLQLDDSYWKVVDGASSSNPTVSRVTKSTPLIMEYGRTEGVEATLKDLEERLSLAGYKELEPVNARGLITHGTYGDNQGGRVNIQIRPKQAQDAITYGVLPQNKETQGASDGNPVYVVIRVYFDDTNQ